MNIRNLVVLPIFLLSGCAYFSQETAAPVVDLDALAALSAQGCHQVSVGETLYQIAWRYGKDYQELADINQIRAPYTIYPGQKIMIVGTRKPPTEKPKSTQSSPKSTPVQASTPSSAPPRESARPNIHEGWQWPVKGSVIQSFSLKGQTLSKGIDISGELGAPVHAASGGTVVYAGNGLRGYGQLIILKHNDAYLSAYGHNRRLLVSEGDDVHKGQKIAEMGRTDAERVKLHFEIRKNGQPIDPIPLLPKSKG